MNLLLTTNKRNFGLTDLVEKINAEPPKTQPRVRPTQALFANGVGMKITFSGEAKTAFSEDYKETVGAGGGISIFGISVGARGSSETSSSTNTSSWDESSGTLTVASTNLSYESNILAVMGETISIWVENTNPQEYLPPSSHFLLSIVSWNVNFLCGEVLCWGETLAFVEFGLWIEKKKEKKSWCGIGIYYLSRLAI